MNDPATKDAAPPAPPTAPTPATQTETPAAVLGQKIEQYRLCLTLESYDFSHAGRCHNLGHLTALGKEDLDAKEASLLAELTYAREHIEKFIPTVAAAVAAGHRSMVRLNLVIVGDDGHYSSHPNEWHFKHDTAYPALHAWANARAEALGFKKW